MKRTAEKCYHVLFNGLLGPAIGAAALSKDRKRRLHLPVKRTVAGLAVICGAVSSFGSASDAGMKIERHETAGIVDLVPGAARGTIEQPLLRGTIAGGQEVLFVITDAGDKDFAEMFGTVRPDSLEEKPRMPRSNKPSTMTELVRGRSTTTRVWSLGSIRTVACYHLSPTRFIPR